MLLIKSKINFNDEFLDKAQKNLRRLNEYFSQSEASYRVSNYQKLLSKKWITYSNDIDAFLLLYNSMT